MQRMTTPAEQETRGAKSTLIAWANKQEGWVRSVVSDLLDAPTPPNEEALASYYKQLLVEKGLGAGDVQEVAPLVDSSESVATGQSLLLRSLTDIRGVNALATGQGIDFGLKATVLFGENGVGKTGYVRILKLIADVRRADAVLPNISASASASPHALVKFETEGAPDEVEWNGERGLTPLTQMDVFDSRATRIHLDEELSFTYTPQDLGLFRLVRDVVEQLKEKLRIARDEKVPGEGASTAKFTSGTVVEKVVSKLGSETDLPALTSLATLTDVDQTELARLRQSVATLQANVVDAAIEVAHSDHEMSLKAQECIAPFQVLDLSACEAALKHLVTARDVHTQATKSALAAENIPGVLGETWKTFIEAGQQYLDADVLSHELKLGDPCIYCRQPLQHAAVALVEKYHAYCTASRQPVDDARTALVTASGTCASVDIVAARALVTKKIATFEVGKAPSTWTQIDTLLAALLERQSAMKSEASIGELPSDIEAVAARVVQQLADLDAHIGKLKLAGAERSTTLATEKTKLQELEDRATLTLLLPDLTKKVEDAKWAKSAKEVLGKLATLSTALTTTMKEASQVLVNSDFKTHFETECNALCAPPVRLEFPGRETVAARKKSLSDRHKLSEILSEGEQRVVALADFLAEAALRPRPTPMVFDDPVNSLDYVRLAYVAQRIAQISQTRQVVVFTHNIWFAIELLSLLDKDAAYYDVQSGVDGKGIVTAGSGPRADSIKQLAGKITKRLGEAAQQTGEDQFESIEKVCGWMRSYCEVLVYCPRSSFTI
jgi:predicted ATPase